MFINNVKNRLFCKTSPFSEQCIVYPNVGSLKQCKKGIFVKRILSVNNI